MKEEPWQKIRYHASSQEILRDCTTGEYVNSITLSVRDVNGISLTSKEWS